MLICLFCHAEIPVEYIILIIDDIIIGNPVKDVIEGVRIKTIFFAFIFI